MFVVRVCCWDCVLLVLFDVVCCCVGVFFLFVMCGCVVFGVRCLLLVIVR